LRPTGLQPFFVDTGFGIAEKLSEKAYQEDTANHWTDSEQSGIRGKANQFEDIPDAPLVERFCARMGEDTHASSWVKSYIGNTS